MQGAQEPTIPVGERIRSLLDEIGKSPAWLAEKVGVSRSTVTRVLKAERNPTADTLKEMAPVLGVDLEQLVAGTDASDRVDAAAQLVARADYEAAVRQVIDYERRAHDLRSQVRDLTEERDRAVEQERQMRRDRESATKSRDEAIRQAHRHEHDAQRYREALEHAVADVAQLQAEVAKMGSAVEASRATGKVGAILAGVAAVVSVANYLGDSDEEDDFDNEDDA